MDKLARIAVIGTGLIGGSILRRIHDCDLDVIGFDPNPDVAADAERLGLPFTKNLDAAVSGRDLVICAAPLGAIAAELHRISEQMSSDGILTDVGSTKGDIEKAAREIGARFIGGHPMAGTEHSGLKAAHPALFDGAAWVLCPQPNVDVVRLRSLIRLITRVLGARVVVMDADRHDETVAMSSHIPHILAGALAGAVERSAIRDSVLALAAGSFRDGTRVAGTSSKLTVDMLIHNSQPVLQQWSAVQTLLDEIIEAIRREDRDALIALFSRATDARRALMDHSAVSNEVTFMDDSGDEIQFLFELGRSGGHVTSCVSEGANVVYVVENR